MSRMTLSAVTTGRIDRPVRVVVYGVEGVGKSTFGADAPSPIFVGAEDGTAQLDTARFPEPQSWGELLEACDELATAPHAYRTVVIDTLDAAERLCWAHVCASRTDKNGTRHKSIEDYPYGAGMLYAAEEWPSLLRRLDTLRAKGMHVVCTAHSHVRPFKNPEGDDFERYEMRLHKRVSELTRDWADAVLFAVHETYAHKDDAKARLAKGISTGKRIAYTQRRAAFDAKNRWSLPEQIPLSWDAFFDAVGARRVLPVVELRERIDEALAGADAALADRVRVAVTRAADDAQQLAKILNRLSVKP